MPLLMCRACALARVLQVEAELAPLKAAKKEEAMRMLERDMDSAMSKCVCGGWTAPCSRGGEGVCVERGSQAGELAGPRP